MKLYEFLEQNRDAVLERCKSIIGRRPAPGVADDDVEAELPVFYQQVIHTLKLAEGADGDSGEAAPAPSLVPTTPTLIGEGAARHGRALQQRGFSLSQVVHIYGTICDSVTSLAHAKGVALRSDEFNLFNRCLDDAIGQAAAEFERERDAAVSSRELEHLGALAHELRNSLSGAISAYAIIKKGVVGVGGRTGAALERSLQRMRVLIDYSLTEVRLRSERRPEALPISVAALVDEVVSTLQPHADAATVAIATSLPRGLELDADPQMLVSVLANLVQNGLKFSRPGSTVEVRARGAEDRVVIEVEDTCGGVTPRTIERLEEPSSRVTTDPGGLGFGLQIVHRAVAAHGGKLRVRDVPGKGCIFTVDLPKLQHGDPLDTSVDAAPSPTGP